MGQTLTFAVLPPLAREMGLSEFQVGSIFAISAVAWILSSPFWGRYSDVRGRRPVILIGITGYTVSMAAFGLSVHASLAGWLGLLPAYIMMIASRTVFGLFGSATVPAAQAFVADRTTAVERPRQIALLQAGMALGTTLGPGVVSLLLLVSMTMPFWGISALALISVVALRFMLPADEVKHTLKGPVERISLLDARILPFLIAGVAMGVCQATTMQTAGFYAIDVLGASVPQAARMVGAALMGSACAGLFCQLVVIRILRPSPRAMMIMGAVCGIACFSLLVFVISYVALFSALVLLGFSFGLIRPGSVAGASLAVGADQQGAVAGVMNVTGAMGVMLAPFVGMTLYSLMPRAPYMLSLALSTGVLLLVLLHPRLRAPRSRQA